MMDDIAALIFWRSRVLEVPSQTVLFHAGDRVRYVHLVERGTVNLERVQASGKMTCVQQATAGDVLAEASVYAENYHCDARAVEDVTVRRVSKADLRRQLDEDPKLANAWAAHLARTVQQTRIVAEIRSMKTVEERLDAWVDAFGRLPAKGRWQALANALAVSREALYRELAKRRASSGQS